MSRLYSRFFQLGLAFLLLITFRNRTIGAEPTVKIRSPKDGSHITQEQEYVLVSGKVASAAANSPNVDILLLLDVSGSTAKYAGVDFPEVAELPNFYLYPGRGNFRSHISGPLNKRNSIFAAEILASRRLLSQLNPETTRVGVVTFGEQAWLRQPLTHDFEKVRTTLDSIYTDAPRGGTNMAAGILLGARELLGTGESEKGSEAVKALLLLTDGIPTLPIRDDSRNGNQANTDLTINAARQAGKMGIEVDAFGLGEGAVSNPRVLVGIAEESGGTYIPVLRPANILAVLDRVSVVGVDFLHVTNETIGQKALQSRLAADGFFASAVPVVEGLNRIQVDVRASDGSTSRDTITVHYQPGQTRSLDLEVFLEREKNLKLEVERLGKSPDQIQKDIDRSRQESLRQSPAPSPGTVGVPAPEFH